MQTPSKMFMRVPGLRSDAARRLADQAVVYAQRDCPKMSGRGSGGITPYYGPGFFGVSWKDDYLWWQDQGVKPRTMRSLAGKVIPMWIDDPTGKERQANPKAKTRTTVNGRTQILIFRKVAPIGSRKTIRKKVGGVMKTVTVPRSYPGAPGRITTREVLAPIGGKVAGQIAKGNGGVRWRFPGLQGRYFLEHAVITAGAESGLSGVLKASYDQIGLPDMVLA